MSLIVGGLWCSLLIVGQVVFSTVWLVLQEYFIISCLSCVLSNGSDVNAIDSEVILEDEYLVMIEVTALCEVGCPGTKAEGVDEDDDGPLSSLNSPDLLVSTVLVGVVVVVGLVLGFIFNLLVLMSHVGVMRGLLQFSSSIP